MKNSKLFWIGLMTLNILASGCGFSLSNPRYLVQGELAGKGKIANEEVILSNAVLTQTSGLPMYLETQSPDSGKLSSVSNPVVLIHFSRGSIELDFNPLKDRLIQLHKDLRDIDGDEFQSGEIITIPVRISDIEGNRTTQVSLSIQSLKQQAYVQDVHESCYGRNSQEVPESFLEGKLVLNEKVKNVDVSLDMTLKLGLIKFYPVFDCS